MKLLFPFLAVTSLVACQSPEPAQDHREGVAADTASEVSGVWAVSGYDETVWGATLVLNEETGEGYFDWVSAEGATGRELVTWSFDSTTRKLSLTGTEMLDPSGRIGCGTYEAELTSAGDMLVDGTWGVPAAPGTWLARR